MKKIFLITAALILTFTNATAKTPEKPKLIIQITIDQLRGGMLQRFHQRFNKEGFRYLLDTGVVYTNAHHRHANNVTITGHTTLSTGADPAIHGMIGNIWFDRASNKRTYNVEDPAYPLLGQSKKSKKNDGRSPRRILVSTFSDELALAQGDKTKIFSVSLKDRGAIAMSGQLGKAFWFSKKEGTFITSQYYYKQYPAWATNWHQKNPFQQYSNKSWQLLHSQETYQKHNKDDRPFEAAPQKFSNTFPHPYGDIKDKDFFKLLTHAPAGDKLTADFAKHIITNENLGQDNITDYLAISFSATDYIGHMFGPESLEAEDNLLQLDKTLANFLNFVDKKIGLKKTLIVLSADHGVANAPEHMAQLGFKATKKDKGTLLKSINYNNLKKHFGIGKGLIKSYYPPYLYLNEKKITQQGLKLNEVATIVAQEISKIDGIFLAISHHDLLTRNTYQTPLTQSIINNYHPKRAGNIYILPSPNHIITNLNKKSIATSHGTPWRYDSHVPIIFAGMSLPAKTINQQVHTTQIAPTLSQILGIKAPSAAFSPTLEL